MFLWYNFPYKECFILIKELKIIDKKQYVKDILKDYKSTIISFFVNNPNIFTPNKKTLDTVKKQK